MLLKSLFNLFLSLGKNFVVIFYNDQRSLIRNYLNPSFGLQVHSFFQDLETLIDVREEIFMEQNVSSNFATSAINVSF